MTKYVKDGKGRFAGSIGSGADKRVVPTAAPKTGAPAAAAAQSAGSLGQTLTRYREAQGVSQVAHVTRDDIFSAQHRLQSGRYVMSDARRQYLVLSRVGGEVFALSERTGLVVRVSRTGAKETRGQVRARIDFPEDTGDMAGTLKFAHRRHRRDGANGLESVGAVVPVSVFD